MREFLRKWYWLVAVVCLLGAVGMVWVVPVSDGHPGRWMLAMMVPFLVVAVMLGTRGFREAVVWRIVLSVYLVFLVPSGLYMWLTDVTDNRNNGWAHATWSNTSFWAAVALEGGALMLPVVIGVSMVFTLIYNSVYWGKGE